MTLENLLSQVGTGTKHLADRYSEYAGPIHDHDHHVFYAYEPSAPTHGHVTASKHSYTGGGYHKSGASMSALTLLAFLFFLHILQQCIKDHMTDMSATQPVVVMTAGRESDDIISKSDVNKIDKTGITEMDEKHQSDNEKINPHTQNKINDIKNAYDYSDSINKKQLMKVHTTNYEKSYESKFKHAYNIANRSSYFPGFVSAMGEE